MNAGKNGMLNEKEISKSREKTFDFVVVRRRRRRKWKLADENGAICIYFVGVFFFVFSICAVVFDLTSFVQYNEMHVCSVLVLFFFVVFFFISWSLRLCASFIFRFFLQQLSSRSREQEKKKNGKTRRKQKVKRRKFTKKKGVKKKNNYC